MGGEGSYLSSLLQHKHLKCNKCYFSLSSSSLNHQQSTQEAPAFNWNLFHILYNPLLFHYRVFHLSDRKLARLGRNVLLYIWGNNSCLFIWTHLQWSSFQLGGMQSDRPEKTTIWITTQKTNCRSSFSFNWQFGGSFIFISWKQRLGIICKHCLTQMCPMTAWMEAN